MENNLNEQLSRIKSMMKMVNEGEYTNEEDINELNGYIGGEEPEKIDGPFMNEIDPSVYEDVSYIESTKAIIMLMRLFRGDLISKNAYDEVYKPLNEINKILKGEYWDKQKDLPF